MAGNYWRKSIINTVCILIVWFGCSLGCGILFRDWCDANLPPIGNAPFGFWMAQQGSILCFVALLVVYAITAGRLDRVAEDADAAEGNTQQKGE